MQVPILKPPEQRWWCPNCVQTAVTCRPEHHTEFHLCRGLKGLLAPMVPIEVKNAHVVAREREDYLGNEIVRHDGEGRPIAAVEVIRDHGNDVAVFAPCAQAKVER